MPHDYLSFDITQAMERDRQLKYREVPICTTGLVFVIEWLHEDDYLFGFGCDSNGNIVKLKLDIEPGLYVACADLDLLTARVYMEGFSIVDTRIHIQSNNFSVYDVLLDESIAQHARLIKIQTKTFRNAIALYRSFVQDKRAYRYAAVTHYWDVTKQIITEQKVLFGKPMNSTFCWFDSKLNIHDLPSPTIPTITFDIETVSTDPNRVPYGDEPDDEFFSISIHHMHTSTIYTLVFLPIDRSRINFDLKAEMLRLDDYPSYAGAQNILEIYTCERHLLERSMQLLYIPNRLHYLIGFNTAGYDIKYLLLRCKYFNLHNYTKQFIWDLTYRFGLNQIHVDFYRVSRLLFKLKSYSLNSVSEHILNEKKFDPVNAVKLRYLFHLIRKHNKLFSHKEMEKLKKDIPSLRDAMHYNNLDTILVSKLIEKTHSIDLLIEEVNRSGITLNAYLGRFNQIKYKVLSELFYTGLQSNCFICTFKPSNSITMLPFRNNLQQLDVCSLEIDLTNHLHNPYLKKGNKYPGGINYCFGEYTIPEMQIYDLRIAYVLLIEKANISDETTIIVPANILKFFFPMIKNRQHFLTYDYLTHTGINATQSKIITYRCINENMYCGGEFPFTEKELSERGTSLIILIIKPTLAQGVLSTTIKKFNENRDNLKQTSKLLEDQVMHMLNMKHREYQKKWKKNKNSSSDEESDEEYSETSKIPGKILLEHKNLIVSDTNFKFNENGLTKENFNSIFDELKTEVKILYNYYEDSYRLRKIVVSSIYGCIGSLNGPLAAAITCIIRSLLLSSAQFVTQDYGCTVYYCDTDSIFVHNPNPTLDLSSFINTRYPFIEIKKKGLLTCHSIERKVMYYMDGGSLKYGQNKNGPKLWNDMVMHFYHKNTIKNYNDIKEEFIKFYEWVYNLNDIELFSHIINLKSEYVTDTPANSFKNYMETNHPTAAGSNKHKIFYYLQKDDYTKTVFRPFFELTSESMQNVNLFKFFNTFKTVFNLIKIHVQNNAAPFNVTISSKFVRILMYTTFVEVYNRKFNLNKCNDILDLSDETINSLEMEEQID